ncbi:MAG: tRNA guanosine(34) transglycosylase Tgt, partial [Desulfobulbus sp.]
MTTASPYRLLHQSTECPARCGSLSTLHGDILTPVFMPVGTLATVKAVTPENLLDLGAQIILGNTYHLFIRPGHELIQTFGGLHGFMNWDKPI